MNKLHVDIAEEEKDIPKRLRKLWKELGEFKHSIGMCISIAYRKDRSADTVNMYDLDQTLLDDAMALGESKRLRGEVEGKDDTGLIAEMEDRYSGVELSTDIFDISGFNKSTDFILTAGADPVQFIKLQILSEINDVLQGIKIFVVPESQDKIMRFLRYFIFEADTIPSTVRVWEDTTKYFERYRELIETILGIELIIKKVKMDGSGGYKKIKTVKPKRKS